MLLLPPRKARQAGCRNIKAQGDAFAQVPRATQHGGLSGIAQVSHC